MFLRYVASCNNIIKFPKTWSIINWYVYSYLEMHREWFGEQFYMQVEDRNLTSINSTTQINN